jgi:hypothetical protein
MLAVSWDAVKELGSIEGHVFISYIREDTADADRLQQVLEAAGVRVWRDKSDLWPGEDWREKIRRAITDNALVFIACFSRKSVARKRSYQNEEMALAIEQLRLRRPGEPWLIPVRFDDCEIPNLDIGSGRTLTSIQRADLFGDHSDEGTFRLVQAVLRILGQYSDMSILGGSTYLWHENTELRDEGRNRVRAAILESMRRESAEIRDQSASTIKDRGFALQSVRRAQLTADRHFRVGMLGPIASGKTTYLAVLDFALARSTDSWVIRGADQAAEQFLSQHVMMLAQQRFPEATQGPYHLSFVLEGTVPTSSRRGWPFSRKQTVELQLDLLDMPGEYTISRDSELSSTSLGFDDDRMDDPREEALEYLSDCDGILLLFDPVIEHQRSHYYEYLRRALLALSNRSRHRGSRLPHHVAVCITKFDDPYVYRKAAAGGYARLAGSTNSMPQMNEEQVRIFFRELCSSTNNADLVMALLEHYFHPKHIRYFATSSIGFYINPAAGRFDSSDFDNVVQEGGYGERRIRGRVRPINVIEPLLWLTRQSLAR